MNSDKVCSEVKKLMSITGWVFLQWWVLFRSQTTGAVKNKRKGLSNVYDYVQYSKKIVVGYVHL